jgi:hypothetical protein
LGVFRRFSKETMPLTSIGGGGRGPLRLLHGIVLHPVYRGWIAVKGGIAESMAEFGGSGEETAMNTHGVVVREIRMLRNHNVYAYMPVMRVELDIGAYDQVIISYREPEPARAAFHTALRGVLAAMHGEPFDYQGETEKLLELADEFRLGPSTGAVVKAARRKNIPVLRLMPTGSLVQLG